MGWSKPQKAKQKAKIAGKGNLSSAFLEYDEYVPMVDKAVDAGWKKEVSHQRSFALKGTLPLPDNQKIQAGIRARMYVMLMAFFTTLFALFHSLTFRVMKKLPETLSNKGNNIAVLTADPMPKEEFRPPSPTPGFTEADLLSSVLKKLGELEEKVDTLQAKPSEMPCEKEELLNAAVCRVDALEAELIATKKALHEALLRQEDLLAYIDSQEQVKFRKKKLFCF